MIGPSAGDFLEGNFISESHLFGHGGLEVDNGGGTTSSGESLDFPLGHNLKNDHLVLLEEVNSELRARSSADNNVDSSFGKSYNEFLELILFSLSVVEELIGVLEENGSLSLSLLHLNVGVKDGNLGLEGRLVGGLGSSNAEHTVDDFGVLDASSENLSFYLVTRTFSQNLESSEAGILLRESVNGGLSDKSGEEIFKSELLGGNGRLNASSHLSVVAEVLSLVAGEFLNDSKSFVTGLLVSDKDLRGMETHLDEADGLTEEFTRERDNKVGTITSFVLLHFGGLSDHLGGGMVDIRLLDDSSGIGGNEKLFEIVDNHLVHTYTAKVKIRDLK